MENKTALFTNWTDEDFTGYWGGKGRTIKSGQSLYMPDYAARHFAKHLTNRELLRTTKKGVMIYPNGDKMTSPKFPEQVPVFMELFNKAYTPDETVKEEEKKDALDVEIEVLNKNKEINPELVTPVDEFETQPIESSVENKVE